MHGALLCSALPDRTCRSLLQSADKNVRATIRMQAMLVRKIPVILIALVAGIANLSTATAADTTQANEHYVLISHAPDSDSWWNTVKNAIKHAGEDFAVQVDYHNPTNGDLADMARLLEQAAARNYDGVAFDIADFDVLSKSARRIDRKSVV